MTIFYRFDWVKKVSPAFKDNQQYKTLVVKLMLFKLVLDSLNNLKEVNNFFC